MIRSFVAVVLALGVVIAGTAAASAATVQTTSSNWAGYAVRRSGTAFRHVRGSWTVPAVDCTTGGEGYSANWVGLGGYATTSQALEQLGTESDCDASGKATYSAWFEVVPSVATTAKLTIKPGDAITASAAVKDHLVTLKITDTTTGATATRTVRAATVDTSSAEWIVEAPALCGDSAASACSQTALANFGSTGFTAARATTRGGHTGTILDAAWTPVAITLSPAAQRGRGGFGFGGGGGRESGARFASGTATPAALTAPGDAFTVDYAAADDPTT